MKTRNIFSIFAAALIMMLLVSCSREGIDFFRGAYGYSLSGSLTCEDEDGNPDEFSLIKEIGSIHIEPKGNYAVLTMDAVGGDVLVFDAEIDGDRITLLPISRMLTIEAKNDGLTSLKSVQVTMSGSGCKTNGLLILDFVYSADPFSVEFEEDGDTVTKVYTIIQSNVNCIANYRD